MPAKKTSGRKAKTANKKTSSTLPRFGFSQKAAVVLVVLFAVTGVASTLISNAAQVVNEETVRMSNGKEIRLGQSVKTVSKILGDQLLKLNDLQYEYPGKEDQPIEVVMDFDERGKLVVIHLVDDPANMTKTEESRVGLDFKEVAGRNRRAKKLVGELAKKREQGLRVEQSRSNKYFLPEHCSATNEVGLVSLTLKGHEQRLLEDLAGPVCEDPHEFLAE